MSTTYEPQPGGWEVPSSNSRKAHFFPEGETRSICGRWAYWGPVDKDNVDDGVVRSKDCAGCLKKLGRGLSKK